MIFRANCRQTQEYLMVRISEGQAWRHCANERFQRDRLVRGDGAQFLLAGLPHIFMIAETLGGVESRDRVARSHDPRLGSPNRSARRRDLMRAWIRLSVGIAHPQDLLEDLKRGSESSNTDSVVSNS